MRLDEEVFAVLMAIIVVASVFSIAQIVYKPSEPFTALGLLDSHCKIGEYPRHIIVGEPVELCIFVYNHLGRPGLFQVRVKLGDRDHLPTNTTPLDSPVIMNITRVLDHDSNFTQKITLVFNKTGNNVALVFELWAYNTSLREWEYTGRWNHLYVNITEVLP